MPVEISMGRFSDGVPVLRWEDPAGTKLRAAGGTPFLQEDGDDLTLPPAGASRAEALFNAVGLILLFVLAVSALWLLLHRRK